VRATDPPEAPVNRTSLFLISVLSIILGILLGRLERRKGRMCLFGNFVFGVCFYAKVLFKLEPECGERVLRAEGGGPLEIKRASSRPTIPRKVGKTLSNEDKILKN